MVNNFEFFENEKWILPKQGTLGNKAKNLLDNTAVIEAHGFKIPRSLVIPHEYFLDKESILDMIKNYFPGNEKVFVRSSSPDEDLGTRTPGFYASEEVYHQDKGDSYDRERKIFEPLEKVVMSYYANKARVRRDKLGLEEKGMSLLVQEPVQADYSGCFSDIGELALVIFTNPDEGLNSMQRPSLAKFRVDAQGNVDGIHFTVEEYLAKKLRQLTAALPKIQDKGWEIEFVGNQDGVYIVQTTPIVKKERFEVKDSEKNIFTYIAVLGTGEFLTDGILYVPSGRYDLATIQAFDKEHAHYCLATLHPNISSIKECPNILNYINNASAVLDLTPDLCFNHEFAPHVEQYMREDRVALAGEVSPKCRLSQTLKSDTKGMNGHAKHNLYSPTKLIISADEIEQRANVEIAGEIEDFNPLK